MNNLDDDARTAPLRLWNHLARENTEDAIVSSMHEVLIAASEPLEKFSSWLLVGTAAIASFFITNADQLLPIISRNGFRLCGLLLILSCLFGLIAKLFANAVEVGALTSAAVQRAFGEHIEKYKEQEKQIQADAELWKITLETGVRTERILKEFYSAFPKWIGKMAMKRINRDAENRQIAFLGPVRNYLRQTYFAAAQSIAFLLFLISGLAHAAMI